MSELSERIGTAAGNAFKSGFNCGEAILQAFRTEGGLKIDDNTMRMVLSSIFKPPSVRNACKIASPQLNPLLKAFPAAVPILSLNSLITNPSCTESLIKV